MTGIDTQSIPDAISGFVSSTGIQGLFTQPDTFIQTMGIQIGTIFVVFVWLLFVFRVAKDIVARTNNMFAQIGSIMMVTLLTPIIGIPMYLTFRPVQYKREKLRHAEAGDLLTTQCRICQGINLTTHTCCIFCGNTLHTKCKHCHTYFPNDHMYCNNCGAPNTGIQEKK